MGVDAGILQYERREPVGRCSARVHLFGGIQEVLDVYACDDEDSWSYEDASQLVGWVYIFSNSWLPLRQSLMQSFVHSIAEMGAHDLRSEERGPACP